VVAAFGRHVLVEDDTGNTRICHPRGKKNDAVVGDVVTWLPSQDEGTIEQVHPRRNLFYRQDDIRTKSFAANLDQILILLGAEPEFSERQLARALIAAEAAGIQPLVVLNKIDLHERFARAWTRLAPYRAMGYTVLPLGLHGDGPSAHTLAQWGVGTGATDLPALCAQHLQGRVTLVLGPSGVGKSTLVNRLVPHALAATNAISLALNSGKHTTTSTRWYWVDPHTRDTALIDSPGFQEFGLHHIEASHLAHLMPDLRVHLGHCKFANCTHRHEPGCGVLSALKLQANSDPIALFINDVRYKIYLELFDELSQPPQW
jgi:ribosome biogenesis GTPase